MNDDITIVSSSDSPEEVQAALTGKTVEQVKAENDAATKAAAASEPPADPKAAPSAATPAAPKAEETAPEPPANETPEQKAERERLSSLDKRKNKIQSQIDDLTSRKHQTRREAEAEEQRLADLRKQREQLEAEIAAKAGTPPAASGAPAAPPAGPPIPKLDDTDGKGNPKYANYEEFQAAVVQWGVEESARRAEQAAAKTVAEQQAAERARIERESASREYEDALAKHVTKLEDFKKTHADFDAVYQQAADAVQDIKDELGENALNIIDRYTTVDADNGPAIIYHLAQHPEEMERIAKLPRPLQLAELGKLDVRLEAATVPARPPVAAPVTKAPEPIKPVSSTPTAPGVPDDEEDYQTYKARRNREERAARGLPLSA